MAEKLSPSPSTLVPVLHSPSPKAPLSPTITLSTPELYEGDRRYSAILVLPNGVSTGDMDMEPEIGDGEILDGVSKAIVLNDKMKEMTETTNDGMNGISGLHTQNDIYSSSWNDDVEVSHTESSLSPNQLKSTTVHPKAVTAGDITAANDYSESLPSNRPINDSGLPRTRPVIAQAIVYTLPHSNPAIPLAGAGAPPTLLPIMEPSSSLPESANSSGLLPVPSAISPNQITDSLPNSSNNYATSPNSIHAPIFKRQNPRSDIAILQYKTGDNGWKQSSNRTQGVFLFTHVDSPHDSPISTPRSRSREFDRDISQDIGIDELSVSLKTKLNKEKPKKYKVRTGKSVLEGDPHWRRKSFDDQRFQPRSHSLSCSENAPSAQSRTQHQQNIRPHDTSLHVSQRLSPPPVDLDSSSESLDDDPESELTKRKKYDNQRFELRSNSPLLTSPSTLKIKNTASRSNSSEFQSPTDEHSLAASANNNSAHHDDHSSHLWSVFGHGHSHDRSTELENKRTNLFARLLHLNSINPDSTGAPPASAKPPPDSNSASRQDGVNTPSQKLASESSSSQGIKTENGTVRRGKSGSLIERIFHIGHSPASDMHSSEIDSASQSSKPTTESPTAATTQSKTAENKNGQDPVKTHRHRHSIDDHDHFISQKKSASAGKTPTVSSWKSHLPHFPHFHLPGHHHSPTDPANSPAHNQKSTVERDRLLSPNILNKDRKRSQSVKVNGTRSLARSNSDTSLAEKYGIPREMLGKGATAAVMLAHKEIADDEEEEDRLSCSSSSAHRDNNSEDGSHARSQRRPNSEIGNIKNSDAGSEVDGNERQNSNNHHDHGVVHSNGKKRERLYAVKKFRKRRPEESERDYIKKLSSEFCISSSLHHENIIETVDLIQDESATWYTIMEYCPGGDLFSRIANGPSPLSSDERNCLFRQLVNGIMYLHGVGVVHRDLKPENLLLSADGKILKIADFGTAEVFRVPWCTTNRMIKGVCGSDPYIAPEEWKNDQSQEYEPTKVDIWAIGIIYYVMIHSTIPWQVAQPHCPHYHYYLSNMGGQYEPIDSLESGPKNVLYGLLDPEPLTRLTLESLILDPWFKEIVFCRPNEEMKHTHHPGVPQGVH